MQIVSHPQREGDRVRFWVAPTGGKTQPRISVLFQADAVVVGFREDDNSQTDANWLQPQVLRYLTQHLQSRREIGDQIRRRTGKDFGDLLLEKVLRRIPESQMIRRFQGRCLFYRQPIEFRVGMAIVENPDSPSQRYGWVEELKESLQHNIEFPVCRWLDGSRSFSSDDLAELVTDPRLLTRIEQAKAIRAGNLPEGFIELPK